MLVIKTLFFTLLAPCTLALLLPYGLLRPPREIFPQSWNSLNFIGIFISLAGVAGYIWCAADFISKGKGTPAPYDPPKQLVVNGLYRITRNPMYLSVSSIVLGEAVFYKSMAIFIYAAVLLLGFHLRVTLYEEPTLKRLFSDSFEDYCQRVPRWIPMPQSIGRKP